MSEPWEDFAEEEGGVAIEEATPPWVDFQPPEQQTRRESLVQAMEEAKPGVGEQALEAAPGALESGINWFRENLERTVNAPVVLGKLVAPKIFPPNMELPIEFGKVPFTLREQQEVAPPTREGILARGRIFDRALEAARFAGGPGAAGRQIAPPPTSAPQAFPPETLEQTETRQLETGAKIVGAELAAHDLMRFFATPEGIATAVAAPYQLARALIAAGFSGEMASQVQEAARQAGEMDATATTPEEKAQATRAKFSLFANIIFPGLIAGGAVKAGNIRPPRVGPIPMPEAEAGMRREIDYPKALAEVRAQVEQGAELADARETLANQIAEAKASQASGKPLSENSIRIMAESLANAMGARLTRQKPKPRGGPSAIQRQGQEIVRNVPPQPGGGPGTVPVQGVPRPVRGGGPPEAGAAGDVPRPTPAGPAGGPVAAPPLAGDHYTIAALGLKRLGVSPGNADALLRGAKDVAEVVSEKNQVEATAILEKFDAAEQKIVEGTPPEEPPAPAAAPVEPKPTPPAAPAEPAKPLPPPPEGAFEEVEGFEAMPGRAPVRWFQIKKGEYKSKDGGIYRPGSGVSEEQMRMLGFEPPPPPKEGTVLRTADEVTQEVRGEAEPEPAPAEPSAPAAPVKPEEVTPAAETVTPAGPEAKFLDIPESQWTPEKLRELIGRGNRKAILNAVNSRLGLKGIHQVSAITTETTLLKRIREVLEQMRKEAEAKPKAPVEEPAPETAKPKPTFEELTAQREKEKAELIARNMAKVPDNATSVKLQDSSGKTAIVSPDIADPKKWRLTYFTAEGEPWGHAVLNTRDEAIQSALGIYGKTYGPPHLSRGYEVVEAKTPSVTEAPKTTLEAPKPSPGPAAVVQAERPPQPPVAQTKGPLKGPQQKKYLISEAQHALEQAPAQQRRVATDADSDQARLEQIEKSVREQVKGRPYGEGESEESLVAAQAGDLFTKYGIPEDYPAYSGQMSIEGKWAQEPRPAGKHGPGDRLRMLNEAIAREQFTKGDNITIEVPGDGTFVIRNSAPALKAFLERAKKFPTTVAKAPQPSQARTTPSHPSPVEKARTVESDVEAVQAFTSTDETRFVLQFVMSDGKHLIATDGRKLVLVNRKGPGTEANPKFFDQEGKLHEYPTTPEALEQAKKDWEEARKKNKKLGKFEGPRFPNWQQVMPTETETWFKNLDTERLFRLAKQAQGVMTEKNRTITLFRDSEGRLGITSGPNDFGDYAADITPSSRPLILVNGDYFLDMVETARKLGLKQVDIGGTPKREGTFPELEPMTMQGPGVKMILMPMRGTAEERHTAARAAGAEIPEPKVEGEEPPPEAPAPQPEPKPPSAPGGIRIKTGGGETAALIIPQQLSVTVERVLQTINRNRKAFGTLFRGRANRRVMDQTFDAADNMAKIVGQQAARSLQLRGNAADRAAAMVIVEAQGDAGRLVEFARQASGNRDALAAVRLAERDWDRLQPLAQETKRLLDRQIHDEEAAGIDTEYREGYVPHIIDRDLLMGSGRPFIIAGRGTGISTGFKKGRVFETIFDAIEAGYHPRTMDVADLVEHRVGVGQRLINRKAWADGLRDFTDPTDQKPLVTDLQRRQRGPGGKFYEVAPQGYSPREIIPGVRIAVHEGYGSLFDALTGTSRISGSVPGRVLLGIAGGIKHVLLAFDTFHASRIGQKEAFLTGKVSYGKGQSLLEYADRDLNEAVRQNIIPQEIADWVRQNRPVANQLIRNGLNVGRIQEGLYADWVNKIPGIGPFKTWVFDKLTRGAILESGLIEFERVSRANPRMTPDEVARKVSRDLNVYFGNLGRQGVFKSATMLDLSRLAFLAPQWVESMVRTEAKGFAQAAKGLTYDPVIHKTLMVGSLGKGVAQGLIAYVVGTQILNLFTRGQFTFQNKEPGHKLDAWIPDWSGEGKGFFLSPLSVVAEVSHDLLRYSKSEPSVLAAAARIAANKASPMTRAGQVLLSGRTFSGEKLVDTWDRVKAAAWALAPTPIPLSPTIKGTEYPGQVQRQLTASLGVKTEPAPARQATIRKLADDWLAQQKDPKLQHEYERQRQQEFGPSDYSRLRNALYANDLKGARLEYDRLVPIKGAKQIRETMNYRTAEGMTKPLLNNRRLESGFLRSLKPEQRELYREAMRERAELYRRFGQMLRETPGPGK